MKTRVQFDLPPQSMERLLKLKEKTEASTYAEVLKNALRVYEAILEYSQGNAQGSELVIRLKDGNIVPFIMLTP